MEAILFSPHPEETNVLQVVLQQSGFLVRSYRSLDQAIEAWPENPPIGWWMITRELGSA